MNEQNQNEAKQSEYFDVITTGYAKLTRPRIVEPDRAKGQKFKSFVAVTVAMLSGPSSSQTRRFIDCKVVGEDAVQWFVKNKENIEANPDVIYQLSIGDARDNKFTYESGAKQGEEGKSIKGRLLKIAEAQELPDVFIIKTRGLGYLNCRKLSETSYALSVSLLAGHKDDVEYIRYDLSPNNPEVNKWVNELKPHMLLGHKVLGSVVLNDIQAKLFNIKNGDNAGTSGTCLASELAVINWVEVESVPFTLEDAEIQSTGTEG